MATENTEMYSGVNVNTNRPVLESLLHFRHLTHAARGLSDNLEKAGLPVSYAGLEHLMNHEGPVIIASNHWTATSDEEKAGTYNVVTIMHSVGVITKAVEMAKPGKKVYVALSEAPRHQAVIDETFGTPAWFKEYARKVKELGRKKFMAYTAANISRKIHLTIAQLKDVIVSPNTGDLGHVKKFIRNVENAYKKNDGYMLIFPEADASPTMLPAEGGVSYLSGKLQVPVLPVSIFGDSEGFHMAFGPVIDPPANISGKERDAFSDRLMVSIASRIPERFRGAYAEKAASIPEGLH